MSLIILKGLRSLEAAVLSRSVSQGSPPCFNSLTLASGKGKEESNSFPHRVIWGLIRNVRELSRSPVGEGLGGLKGIVKGSP